MFFSLVPYFDNKMTVKMYCMNATYYNLDKNEVAKPIEKSGVKYLGTKFSANKSNFPFDTLKTTRPDAISGDTPLLIPINTDTLASNHVKSLFSEYTHISANIVLAFDLDFCKLPNALTKLAEIKKLKYSVSLIGVTDFSEFSEILDLTDYVILDRKLTDGHIEKQFFIAHYPKIKLILTGIEDETDYKNRQKDAFPYYEGNFYRLPMKSGSAAIAPIKYNYIRLLNIANTDNFEISDVAGIAEQDTAIAISLLKMVNRLGFVSEIKSIDHAAAMLGQAELRQWITTAIVHQMYQDKPSEITRLSLIRAKFAENLCNTFELSMFGKELFLMGLFSVLDIVFDIPLEHSLREIKLPANVQKALLTSSGPFGIIIDFMRHYEKGDWDYICDVIEKNDIDGHDVATSYLDALKWYQSVLSGLGD